MRDGTSRPSLQADITGHDGAQAAYFPSHKHRKITFKIFAIVAFVSQF